jgi:hypothetical protein
MSETLWIRGWAILGADGWLRHAPAPAFSYLFDTSGLIWVAGVARPLLDRDITARTIGEVGYATDVPAASRGPEDGGIAVPIPVVVAGHRDITIHAIGEAGHATHVPAASRRPEDGGITVPIPVVVAGHRDVTIHAIGEAGHATDVPPAV